MQQLASTDLISVEYAQINAKLHQSVQQYGTSGHTWARLVRVLATFARTDTLLDYGCGKQTLAAALTGLSVTPYDPGIPGLEALPAPHRLVVCGDVLEHIEEDRLEAVLAHITSLTKGVVLIVVSTRAASKTLENGQNAHLIVKPPEWWIAKIEVLLKPLFLHNDNDARELLIVAIPRCPLRRYLFMRLRFLAAGGLNFQRVLFKQVLMVMAQRERRREAKTKLRGA